LAERPDYYAVLGVDRDTSQVAIRAAYRRLVLSHHPDRHPGDPAATTRLKHLVQAYETLSDEALRSAYDSGSPTGHPIEPGAPWEELLGRVVDAVVGPKDARPIAGRDHQYRLALTTPEAARGCTRPLDLPWPEICEACEGRGFPLEVFPTVCERCQGAGCLEQRRMLRRVLDRCETCEGRGYLVVEPCAACEGARSREARKVVNIDVPAGVSSGDKLVVRGAGEPGTQGGQDGDCFVVVVVEPHPVLSVSGRDVLMRRPVTALQVLAGEWITVPTVDGPRRLRLPVGAQDGAVLRMPGLGVGASDESHGDQLVTLEVEHPSAVDETGREALEHLAAHLGPEAFPRTARFDLEHAPEAPARTEPQTPPTPEISETE